MAEKELQKVRMYRNTVTTEVDTDKHTDSNGLYVYSLSGDIYVGNTRIATDCETVGKTLTVNTIATKEELNVEATQRCDYLETYFTGLYETEKQEREAADYAINETLTQQSSMITTNDSRITDLITLETASFLENLVDLIYPVGSIVIFYNSTDPRTIYPNTDWELVPAGYFLRSGGTSSTYTPSGADSRSITLTTANLPSHCHSLNKHNIQTGADGSGSFYAAGVYADGTNANNAGSTSYVGSGHAFTVTTIPKHYVVKIWRRTA